MSDYAERIALNKTLAKIGDEENLTALYMRVFNTDDGKLVLQDLKNRAFFYLPTYQGDDRQGLINEGMRLAVVNIESRLLPLEVKPSADTETL